MIDAAKRAQRAGPRLCAATQMLGDVFDQNTQPMAAPNATPTANVVATDSMGYRCTRLLLSTYSSLAAWLPCFAARRAASTPSSSASATADAVREALRAVTSICSPNCSNTGLRHFCPDLSCYCVKLICLICGQIFQPCRQSSALCRSSFSSASRFQVGVIVELAGLLLDCALDFCEPCPRSDRSCLVSS